MPESNKSWLERVVTEHKDFESRFCENCEYLRTIPGTWDEHHGGTPPESDCPAHGDGPFSDRCPRRDEIESMCETLADAARGYRYLEADRT